jgi:hypothetical protein
MTVMALPYTTTQLEFFKKTLTLFETAISDSLFCSSETPNKILKESETAGDFLLSDYDSIGFQSSDSFISLIEDAFTDSEYPQSNSISKIFSVSLPVEEIQTTARISSSETVFDNHQKVSVMSAPLVSHLSTKICSSFFKGLPWMEPSEKPEVIVTSEIATNDALGDDIVDSFENAFTSKSNDEPVHVFYSPFVENSTADSVFPAGKNCKLFFQTLNWKGDADHKSVIEIDALDTLAFSTPFQTGIEYFRRLPWQFSKSSVIKPADVPLNMEIFVPAHRMPDSIQTSKTATAYFHNLPWQGHAVSLASVPNVTDIMNFGDLASLSILATQTALQAAQNSSEDYLETKNLAGKSASKFFVSLPW